MFTIHGSYGIGILLLIFALMIRFVNLGFNHHFFLLSLNYTNNFGGTFDMWRLNGWLRIWGLERLVEDLGGLICVRYWGLSCIPSLGTVCCRFCNGGLYVMPQHVDKKTTTSAAVTDCLTGCVDWAEGPRIVDDKVRIQAANVATPCCDDRDVEQQSSRTLPSKRIVANRGFWAESCCPFLGWLEVYNELVAGGYEETQITIVIWHRPSFCSNTWSHNPLHSIPP